MESQSFVCFRSDKANQAPLISYERGEKVDSDQRKVKKWKGEREEKEEANSVDNDVIVDGVDEEKREGANERRSELTIKLQ